MNIYLNNTISFGQLVSTSLLLRAGSGVMNFEDAKLFNNELGIKVSGKIGFHQRAMKIAQTIYDSNPNFAKIFEELRNTPQKQLELKIKQYSTHLGEKIDIEI